MQEYKEKLLQLLRDKGTNPNLSSLEIGLMEDCFKRGTPEYQLAAIIYELRNNPF